MVSLGIAVFLALIHLFAGQLRFLNVIPRSRWLSLAGGASVAYVFVHLLPELAHHAQRLEHYFGTERSSHLIALAGLALFYGVERMAVQSRRRVRRDTGQGETPLLLFWLHISSFTVYNLLIGYLLVRGSAAEQGELMWFGLAMALHFLVNDYGLHQHHKRLYQRTGRWLVAAAVLLGYGVGRVAEVPEVVVAVLTAFIAGGIILNVLKEELPEERESRFWAFAVGVVAYTLLLLMA